jgi:4-amino-4-deoxy-L-arabinose transferase-like glycosyltransferase
LEFLKGFLLKHNVERYLTPMENHRGPVYYYLIVIFFGFMPWAVLMGLGCWSAWPFRGRQPETTPVPKLDRDARRFLWCWALVYLLFFTVGSTKLPGYVLPVYVPLAVFMGHFFDRWRRGVIQLPGWMMVCGMIYLGLVGVGFAVGTLVAAGRWSLPFLDEPPIQGLESWAVVGLIPLTAALFGSWRLWRRDPTGVVIVVTSAAVMFVAILAGGTSCSLESDKSPAALAAAWQREQTDREVRLGCYRYFQPSLVFYSRREVMHLGSPRDVKEFLQTQLEVYLCVPEQAWETEVKPRVKGPVRVIARRYDMYHKCDVVVVTNR